MISGVTSTPSGCTLHTRRAIRTSQVSPISNAASCMKPRIEHTAIASTTPVSRRSRPPVRADFGLGITALVWQDPHVSTVCKSLFIDTRELCRCQLHAVRGTGKLDFNLELVVGAGSRAAENRL